MDTTEIEEIQGLYGPFTLSERVVQKIWLRQDFSRKGLRTASGALLEIKDAGRWNLLDGPDFKGARISINGLELAGDVEIHFRQSDWSLHGHDSNPKFNHVILHVVLHPAGSNQSRARTANGREPDVLFLLPLLDRDLESHMMDEALLELEQQDSLEWVVAFIERPLEERWEILSRRMEERWEQKLAFARLRLESDGWDNACHQFALEALGYARNRAGMSQIALRYPISVFREGKLSAEALFEEFRKLWQLSGLRPANRPQKRLQQYLEIVRQRPDWTVSLQAFFEALPAPQIGQDTADFRRSNEIPKQVSTLSREVFSGVLGEKRLNTLMCDAFLPLATAHGLCPGWEFWRHWLPGDAPENLRRFLKHAGITNRKYPQSNGTNQGALALFINQGC